MICPFCKEEIKDGALKCKHCNSMLDGSPSPILNSDSGIPGGILAAGILMFLWAFVFGGLVLLNFLSNTVSVISVEYLALMGWNLLITTLYIVFGIGVLKKQHWGYDWGLGSNVLNLFLGIYEISQGKTLMAIFVPIEIAIIFLLLSNKKYFRKKESVIQTSSNKMPTEQTIESSKKITEPVTNKDDSFNRSWRVKPKSELLGYLLLLIPLISVALFWLWIPSQSNISNKIFLISIGTIVVTAIFAMIEAIKLKFGKDKEKTGYMSNTGPITWFLGIILFWIFVYPLYLFQRSKKGVRNLLLPGIAVTLIFIFSMGWPYLKKSNIIDIVKNGHLQAYGDEVTLGQIFNVVSNGLVTWKSEELPDNAKREKEKYYVVDANWMNANNKRIIVRFIVDKNSRAFELYGGFLDDEKIDPSIIIRDVKSAYLEQQNTLSTSLKATESLNNSLKDKFMMTFANMKSIGTAIELFIVDNSFSPKVDSIFRLKNELEPNYLKNLPAQDAWSNTYNYFYGGVESDLYFICSAGDDGKFMEFDRNVEYKIISNPKAEDFINGKDIVYANGTYIDILNPIGPRPSELINNSDSIINTSDGFFINLEVGDYNHIIIKDRDGKEHNFMITSDFVGKDKFDFNNYKNDIGKKVRFTWKLTKEFIQEANDNIEMEKLLSLEWIDWID